MDCRVDDGKKCLVEVSFCDAANLNKKRKKHKFSLYFDIFFVYLPIECPFQLSCCFIW